MVSRGHDVNISTTPRDAAARVIFTSDERYFISFVLSLCHHAGASTSRSINIAVLQA